MQVNRIIVRLAAVIGLGLALTLGSVTIAPAIAGAQYEGGYDGGADCPPGYEGYAGYEGCGEGTDPGTAPDETAAPPSSGGGSLGGSLPRTGGVAVLGLAGTIALAGLALRRLVST